MSGFLEGYGAGEEKREKLIRRIALALALLVAASIVFYFAFRNYRETRQAKRFLELLEKKDFAAAYQLWGCTKDSPCSGYTMEKFLEDWGSGGVHKDVSSPSITMIRGCSDGVIVGVQFGQDPPDYLWVDRKTRNLGFAPQYVSDVPPVCNPRIPVP